ncbi:MAG: cell division protein FtsQ/DivIB [Actinomycetota bacterium]
MSRDDTRGGEPGLPGPDVPVPEDVAEVSAEVLDELGRLFGDAADGDVADGGTDAGLTDAVIVIDDVGPAGDALDPVPGDDSPDDDLPVDDSAGDDSPVATVVPFVVPAPASLGDPLIVIDDEPDVVDPRTDVDPRFEERRRVWARRDRLRRVRWVKIAGLIVALAVVVSVVLASPLFAIRTFTVEGNVYTSSSSVSEVRRILKGTSIFTADTARARAVLLRDPWVADVRITTHFPSKVVVEVSERTPVVWYVGTDNKARIVDARGSVIDVLDGFPTKYLQVKGTGAPVEAGSTADDAYRAAAQLVLALPDEIRPKVTALDLSPAGELSMVLKGDTLVRFGTPVDLQNKLVAVVVLLRRQDPKTIAVIDVSAGDPTVLGR